jgi:O-antigen ligase
MKLPRFGFWLWLFYFWVWLIPFENIKNRLPYGPTGINHQNIMMLLMLVFVLRTRRDRGFAWLPSGLSPLLWAFLALTYAGMVNTWNSFQEEIYYPFSISSWGVQNFLQFFNSFFVFWVSAAVLDSREKIQGALVTLALAGGLVFRGFYLETQWAGSYLNRKSWPFVYLNANNLAAFGLYMALFLLLFAPRVRTRWMRYLLYTVGLFYIYVIMFTFSRGSQLALVVVILLLAVLRYQWLIVPIAIAIATYTDWVPASVMERWEMTYDPEEGELEDSAASRQRFRELAFELFWEKPVMGHGLRSFRLLNPEGLETHNFHIQTLFELGFTGFGVFVLIWLVILWVAFVLWRRAERAEDRQYGLALFMATVGLVITNYFGDRFTHMAQMGHYWVLVAVAARLYAHHRGRALLAEPPHAEEAPPMANEEAQVAERATA